MLIQAFDSVGLLEQDQTQSEIDNLHHKFKMESLRVGYQGVPGAYSEQAVRQILPSKDRNAVQTIGFENFERVYQAIQNQEIDYGVLPIENSLGGSIHANYDLVLKYGLHIVGETDFRVRHSLVALPGVQIEDIETVISHPQALAQCANFISTLKGGKGALAKPEYDTAGSAKIVADEKLKHTAAIASSLAAEYYGLQVLQSDVEDDDSNYTRFLLLSTKEVLIPEEEKAEIKTSIAFSFANENEKGQLHKALSVFSLRDIDLTKIESRPWGYTASQAVPKEESIDFSTSGKLIDRRKYRYLFYVDILGYQYNENVTNALRHLREFCKLARVLGSYPTNGVLVGDVRDRCIRAGVDVSGANVAVSSQNESTSVKHDAMNMKEKRLNIGIIGFGNFGQFLAKTFRKYHNVRATSRSDHSKTAAALGCEYYPADQAQEFYKDLDVLLVSVSILSFEGTMKKLPAELLKNVLVVDVLSVKTHPKQILLDVLPEEADILCTHPMFGPESGKYSWRSLPMMYEKVRVQDHKKCALFLRIFELEMCKMLEMTCEMHDKYAASSQFLTHLTGRILSVQGIESTPIDTRGFRNVIRLVEDTVKDSFDLFCGLYRFNPNSESILQKFEDSLRHVRAQLHSAAREQNEDMSSRYPLNPLLSRVAPSKTVFIHSLTKQLEAEGKQVFSLCVGEPDYNPHEEVIKAGKKAFDDGELKYTEVSGTLALRKAISKYLHEKKHVSYDPKTEILVSSGAKQSVFQALMTVCQPGEQILIPSPYWVSYPAMASLVYCEPLILKTKLKDHFLINPEELEDLLSKNPRTKAMILCNPSNPVGVLHSPELLEKIAEVLRKPQFRHIVVVADEIYEQLVYQDEGTSRKHVSFATLPGMYERTLIVNGFSKSHAMTGLRIGYLAGPSYFVKPATKLQGQLTSCASSVGQAAALKAMELEFSSDVPLIASNLEVMDKKRKFVVDRLLSMKGVSLPHPTAAFYVLFDLSYYFAKNAKTPSNEAVVNSDKFCEYLLQDFHTALVPGSAFGEDNSVRLSYATSLEVLEGSLNGLENCLKSLILDGN